MSDPRNDDETEVIDVFGRPTPVRKDNEGPSDDKPDPRRPSPAPEDGATDDGA